MIPMKRYLSLLQKKQLLSVIVTKNLLKGSPLFVKDRQSLICPTLKCPVKALLGPWSTLQKKSITIPTLPLNIRKSMQKKNLPLPLLLYLSKQSVQRREFQRKPRRKRFPLLQKVALLPQTQRPLSRYLNFPFTYPPACNTSFSISLIKGGHYYLQM